MVWDIITKFSPVVKLYGNPLCTKYEGYRCTKIWISRQNRQKHQMGVAGSIFEPHPPNFVRIQFFMSCKNAEIFVMISQLVPDLAKISVSETSISWDVLGLIYTMDYSISSGLITLKGFFQVRNHKEYQNVVIISFVHLEKINIFCFMHKGMAQNLSLPQPF